MSEQPGKVDAKLGANVFKLDQEPHIVIDTETCRTVCTRRVCLQVCPADLYETNDQGDMTVNWEGCLECGRPRSAHGIDWTCRISHQIGKAR